jgi:hypothetical protein
LPLPEVEKVAVVQLKQLAFEALQKLAELTGGHMQLKVKAVLRL